MAEQQDHPTGRRTTVASLTFEEVTQSTKPCGLCNGRGGSGVHAGAPVGELPFSFCRHCIEVMYDLTHHDLHNLSEYRDCPVCAPRQRKRGDERKVIPCRYRQIRCDRPDGDAGCEREAIVTVGAGSGAIYVLPPGWGVWELSTEWPDFHRFVCGTCRVARGS